MKVNSVIRTAGMVIVITARVAPVHFLHESARTPAVNRFVCPDGKDYTLLKGYQARIEYDECRARNVIVEVSRIPLWRRLRAWLRRHLWR